LTRTSHLKNYILIMKKVYKIICWLGLAIGVSLLVGCMNTVKGPTYVDNYKQALQAESIDLEAAGISSEWVGQHFSSVMNHFKSSDVKKRTKTAFAEQVYFNDTWHTHRNSETLGDYLQRTGDKVSFIEVLVDDVVISKKNAYVRWNMSIIVDEKDQPINSVGMTHLRFNKDKKIVTYQDYWDGIEGFYRTLPVIGGILEMIRKKLA